MKKWLVTGLVILMLAGLAASAGWWLPPLLAFVGANTDLIQGLTDLVQLILWGFTGLATIVGLWRSTRSGQSLPPVKRSMKSTVTASGRATVASQHGVAGGQMAVGRDHYGDVIIIAEPQQLWQMMGRSQLPEDLRQTTQKYLEYLVDRYLYLDFKGMGVNDRVPLRLPLVEMYVP